MKQTDRQTDSTYSNEVSLVFTLRAHEADLGQVGVDGRSCSAPYGLCCRNTDTPVQNGDPETPDAIVK